MYQEHNITVRQAHRFYVLNSFLPTYRAGNQTHFQSVLSTPAACAHAMPLHGRAYV